MPRTSGTQGPRRRATPLELEQMRAILTRLDETLRVHPLESLEQMPTTETTMFLHEPTAAYIFPTQTTNPKLLVCALVEPDSNEAKLILADARHTRELPLGAFPSVTAAIFTTPKKDAPPPAPLKSKPKPRPKPRRLSVKPAAIPAPPAAIPAPPAVVPAKPAVVPAPPQPVAASPRPAIPTPPLPIPPTQTQPLEAAPRKELQAVHPPDLLRLIGLIAADLAAAQSDGTVPTTTETPLGILGAMRLEGQLVNILGEDRREVAAQLWRSWLTATVQRHTSS